VIQITKGRFKHWKELSLRDPREILEAISNVAFQKDKVRLDGNCL